MVAKSLVRFVALKSNRIKTVDLLHIEGDLRSQFDVRFTCKLQVWREGFGNANRVINDKRIINIISACLFFLNPRNMSSDEVPIPSSKTPVPNKEKIRQFNKRNREQIEVAQTNCACLFVVTEASWYAHGKCNDGFEQVDRFVTWMKEKSPLIPADSFAEMMNHEDVLRRILVGKACKSIFFLYV